MVLDESPQKRRISAGGFNGVDHVIEIADTAVGGFKSAEERIVPIASHWRAFIGVICRAYIG